MMCAYFPKSYLQVRQAVRIFASLFFQIRRRLDDVISFIAEHPIKDQGAAVVGRRLKRHLLVLEHRDVLLRRGPRDVFWDAGRVFLRGDQGDFHAGGHWLGDCHVGLSLPAGDAVEDFHICKMKKINVKRNHCLDDAVVINN